jgi:indole-3-acetate monooxygenase
MMTEPQTLTNVRDMLPAISAQAGEFEHARDVPPRLVDELVKAGCYRMAVPASHGGTELPMPEMLAVLQALASADASVGWLVGQAAVAQLVFSRFPQPTFDEIYRLGPDVIGAGAVAPKGKALRTDDGWRFSGEWPFVSGCAHASWFYGQCLVAGDAQEAVDPEIPPMRVMVVPMATADVQDTWHTLGLRATGSHHVRVVGGRCSELRSCSMHTAEPWLAHPIYAVPAIEYGGMVVAAVAIGIAEGAISDMLEIAATKRPAFSVTMLRESKVFQDRLGEAYMGLLTARSLLEVQAALAWQAAARGHTGGCRQRGVLRATAAHAVGVACRTVDAVHALAGGSVVYDGSPLQRRMRDIHTVTQHAVTGRASYEFIGSVLVGEHDDH